MHTIEEEYKLLLDEHNKLREAIGELADDITEKRSDICEILTLILEEGEWSDREVYKTEHRFIDCDVPAGATSARYDTLRTIMEFQMPDGTWEDGINHEYTD